MSFILCPGCSRRIEESVMERASAHAPGCSKWRSLLGKAQHAERQAKAAKAADRAAARIARKATEAFGPCDVHACGRDAVVRSIHTDGNPHWLCRAHAEEVAIYAS